MNIQKIRIQKFLMKLCFPDKFANLNSVCILILKSKKKRECFPFPGLQDIRFVLEGQYYYMNMIYHFPSLSRSIRSSFKFQN